jgi:hypothetical protein
MRNKAKMLRARIIATVDSMATCPHTMKQVDILADNWDRLDTLLAYLWRTPDEEVFGYNSLTAIAYSSRKQAALTIVTGKTWQEWLAL